MKRKVIESIAFLLTWVVVYIVVGMMFYESPSRVAYGGISSWWAALYLCRLVNIRLGSFFLIIVSGIPFLTFLNFI